MKYISLSHPHCCADAVIDPGLGDVVPLFQLDDYGVVLSRDPTRKHEVQTSRGQRQLILDQDAVVVKTGRIHYTRGCLE